MIDVQWNKAEIFEAFDFAVKWHGDQKRTGGAPYWTHLVEVLNLLDEYYIIPEVEELSASRSNFASDSLDCFMLKAQCMREAALLHDVLEDTACTREEILKFFHEFTLGYVLELTDKYTHSAYPNLNRKERKTLERMRMSSVSAEAQTIKCCDIISNVRSSRELTHDFAKRMMYEKQDLLDDLNNANWRPRNEAREAISYAPVWSIDKADW